MTHGDPPLALSPIRTGWLSLSYLASILVTSALRVLVSLSRFQLVGGITKGGVVVSPPSGVKANSSTNQEPAYNSRTRSKEASK